MNIGYAIRTSRKAQGLSLSEVSRRADMSVSYLSLIEKGVREPSISILKSIAQALGISASVLVLLAAEPHELNLLEEDLAKRLTSTILDLLHEKARQQTFL